MRYQAALRPEKRDILQVGTLMVNASLTAERNSNMGHAASWKGVFQ